ncbi:substrate-binding domain-containing protein [Shinella yambaruensis]|uniref:D-xylose ABC transporter substrate-binding protein n=1 Tax=Shinella yambaruensis TaxID=415996 RepID=A0ABQ5ZIL1_9HYPH|nr:MULTISPECIES: substrate-binding domain-containing protein [Shinella]MCJ8027151.1 substrate-binding domain-containing protein [Shinella yambaruensis]MCU7981207.1 substrate-binding domain-containing protein [Shinella yambaruensis]MCW5709173.1 substrate-binding domain-containing protein [Shinella sp.]GLR52648.1 D-xylose ABC transporter substrate-binding protein [Shinella yambaruensis]
MKRTISAALLSAAALFSSVPAKAAEPSGTVYLLVPNVTTNRWAKFDIPNMTEAMKTYAPGVELKVLNANDDMQQQVSQAESALASGALGIILVSVDPPRSASILARAEADGVHVVTYAHDPGPGPVSYHVSVPFSDIGEAQGKYLAENLPDHRPVRLAYMLGDPKFAFYPEQMKGFDKYLKPLIDNGTVEVVCQADALLYLAANAQKNMEQCLTKTNNEVDGVVVMNDDTGGGVIAALSAQDLVGKVKVYGGYDATLEGIQRVLLGWQAADMAPPYKQMADAAIQLIVSKVKGEEAPAGIVNGNWPNNFTEGGVPARLEPNVFITTDNVQETVIDAGLFTKEELCGGIGKDADFCKN